MSIEPPIVAALIAAGVAILLRVIGQVRQWLQARGESAARIVEAQEQTKRQLEASEQRQREARDKAHADLLATNGRLSDRLRWASVF